MIRFEWNGYIRDQLHWAQRLAALASDQSVSDDSRMLDHAKRAMENAKAAHAAQLADA